MQITHTVTLGSKIKVSASRGSFAMGVQLELRKHKRESYIDLTPKISKIKEYCPGNDMVNLALTEDKATSIICQIRVVRTSQMEHQTSFHCAYHQTGKACF